MDTFSQIKKSKLYDINVTLLFYTLNLQTLTFSASTSKCPFCSTSSSIFYNNFAEKRIRPQPFVFFGGKPRQNKTNKTFLSLFDSNTVKPKGIIFLPLTFSNLMPPSFSFSGLLPNNLCIYVPVCPCLCVCVRAHLSLKRKAIYLFR